MISTIIIHATAAMLLVLSLFAATVLGVVIEKKERETVPTCALITMLLAVSAFILQVVA